MFGTMGWELVGTIAGIVTLATLYLRLYQSKQYSILDKKFTRLEAHLGNAVEKIAENKIDWRQQIDKVEEKLQRQLDELRAVVVSRK